MTVETRLEPEQYARISFVVPTDVPERHTTAQLPPMERIRGHVHLRLYAPDGTLAVERTVPVDETGTLTIPLPDDPAPGRWELDRSIVLRTYTLHDPGQSSMEPAA